jgi:drug/metabolite transporter (DMT)-like permease
MTRKKATATGFVAVLLWALLALLTVGSAPVPPLLLNALTFAVGGAVGLVWLAVTRSWHELVKVPLKVYAFGTFALFGYHLLYFSALRLAPPAEASLIAYLWPLFIVLFSGLLPGERLTRLHVAGAALAFAGAALIVMRDSAGWAPGQGKGLGLAFLAALTWSSYSVLSRRLGKVPTVSVAVFCIGTAILSAASHVMIETPAWPETTWGWLACLALGLGPVGLAFYVWDIGMKQGDIQLLGVSAYAAPLLSTLILIAAGISPATPQIAVAAVLITAGAALAARASARNDVRQ